MVAGYCGIRNDERTGKVPIFLVSQRFVLEVKILVCHFSHRCDDNVDIRSRIHHTWIVLNGEAEVRDHS